MRPVAQGRPGTEVIPAGWSDAHRPVLATTRSATVALRRPGGTPGGTPGAFDPVTGTTPITPFPAYYTGPARIQVLPSLDQQAMAGEQEISTLGYAVMLDSTVAGVQLEDLCTVTAMDDNGDADLVDRSLPVRSIERGSLHWERRLICSDDLETATA